RGEDRASSLPELRAIGVGGDAELLDDFVAELIGRAIAAPRLGKEGVIVVRAIHQKAVLKSPGSAKRQVAVRVGGETARVLGHSRSEQRHIGEASSIQWQALDGLLRDDLRNIADLGLHRLRLFAHYDRFRGPDQCQAYL